MVVTGRPRNIVTNRLILRGGLCLREDAWVDTEHLSKLRGGTRGWNAWRRDNSTVIPDLTGADLTRADLTVARQTLWQGRCVGLEGESEHG